MVRKKINNIRHILVFVLTVMIFFMGILIGNEVEDLRVNDLYLKLQEQDLQFQNIVTERDYIENLVELKENNKRNVSCEFLHDSYIKSLTYLDDSRIKLEYYIENADSSKETDYELLKEYYSNVQINYWLLANKINAMCSLNMKTILYFYADKEDCPDCEDQGVHLNYVKKKLKEEVLIFVFDREKEGPINLIANSYGILPNQVPSVVIENEVRGFIDNDGIFEMLCDSGLENEVCGEE